MNGVLFKGEQADFCTSCTSLYFSVLPCTSLYFSVLLGTSLYFSVLLGTSWYFSVLLYFGSTEVRLFPLGPIASSPLKSGFISHFTGRSNSERTKCIHIRLSMVENLDFDMKK
jgi:hypothetical protein